MKGLYTRIGRHYFANPEARSLALGFYHKLSELCSTPTPMSPAGTSTLGRYAGTAPS